MFILRHDGVEIFHHSGIFLFPPFGVGISNFAYFAAKSKNKSKNANRKKNNNRKNKNNTRLQKNNNFCLMNNHRKACEFSMLGKCRVRQRLRIMPENVCQGKEYIFIYISLSNRSHINRFFSSSFIGTFSGVCKNVHSI